MNRRSLYRCRHDRRLGGVAAGVAEFFDLDPTLVRIVWALSILFGGFGLLLYIVMWIIVPNEPLGDQEPQPPGDGGSAHRHGSGTRNGGLGATFLGIALIVFGALALADNFVVDWGYRAGFLWPGFVLALGILLVAIAFGRREPEAPGFTEPPDAPTLSDGPTMPGDPSASVGPTASVGTTASVGPTPPVPPVLPAEPVQSEQ